MAGTTCATNALQKDILEDAYEHMQKLVTKICWKFTRRYGGDFYEWLSEANMIFLDACETYNGRSSLVTWLYYKLHWGLYNVIQARQIGKRVHIDGEEEWGIIIRVVGDQVHVEYEDGAIRKIGRQHLTFMDDVPFSMLEATDLHDITETLPSTTSNALPSFIHHVSDSSQELWFLLLDPPDELRGELDEAHPEATWDAIQRYCEWKLRWTWKEMQTAIAELRELCLTD
jgi:hypothetical protein